MTSIRYYCEESILQPCDSGSSLLSVKGISRCLHCTGDGREINESHHLFVTNNYKQPITKLNMEVNQVLELYPEYSISVTLFDNVSNMSELKEMLIQGKLDAALVNATMVPDVFAVLLAANKAVHLSENSKIKTRSVYSEIVFNLSPSNNISESLKTFGLNENDSAILVVVINKGKLNKMNSIIPLISGEQTCLTKLQSIADENRIKKVYKIPESELTCGSLTDAVVTRIATKDAN